MAPMPEELEHDDLDGCEIDFTPHAVDDEAADLLALFPDGVANPAKAEEWRGVFGDV